MISSSPIWYYFWHYVLIKFCLGKKKVEISDEQLAEVIKIDAMRTQMQKAVDHLKEEYVKNLSLRTTTGM
jgi:ribosome recycling factor